MASATGNILLRISSSLGPGGLASLQSGITMVGALGSKVADTIRELDKFSRVMETVDMKMVNYADSAAKGQVDTYQLMKSLNEIKHSFANTGAELTAEDFRMLSTAATRLAQTTGKDATTAFKQLTDSVSKGTTRALKEYGIYIQQGTDLGKTHRQILEELRKSYGDLEIEIKTTTEQLDRMSNAWGTFTSALYSTLQSGDLGLVSDAFAWWTEELEGASRALTEGSQAWKDYAFSVTGALDAIFNRERFDAMSQFLNTIGASNEKLKQDIKEMAEITDMLNAPLEEFGEGGKYYEGPEKKAKKAGGGGKRTPSYAVAEDYAMDPNVVAFEHYRGNTITNRAQYEAAATASEQDAWSTPLEHLIGPKPAGMRERSPGYEEYPPEAFAVNVDTRLEEMQKLEEQRVVDFEAWKHRQEEWEVKQAEIYDWETGWQTAQLQFADDFASTWESAFARMSAGAYAANASMNLLRRTWDQAIKSAILGEKTSVAALKAIVHEVGMAIAQEAGWRALMEFAHAIASAATYQYGEAAQHAAAGAMYTALAVAAGAASAATKPASSGATAASYGGGADVGGGGYNQSYGGNTNTGEQKVTIEISTREDELFDFVVRKNGEQTQAGHKGFSEENAA